MEKLIGQHYTSKQLKDERCGMGEGVSPSLSRDRFPVATHLVVSDSDSCKHGFSMSGGSVAIHLTSFYLVFPRKQGASPFLTLKKVTHARSADAGHGEASSGARVLEIVNTAVGTNVAAVDVVSGDAVTSVDSKGINADSEAIFSDLQGTAPLSSILGRSEHGSCPKVSIYGLGGGLGGDFCSSPLSTAKMASRKAVDCHDASRSGASHVLPISGQQFLGFIGSGESAQAGCGDMFRSWVLNLRLPDLLESGSCVPDSDEGVVKGYFGDRSLVPSNAATAMATEDGIPTGTTPTAGFLGLFTAGFVAGVTDPDVSSGKGGVDTSWPSHGVSGLISQPFQAEVGVTVAGFGMLTSPVSGTRLSTVTRFRCNRVF